MNVKFRSRVLLIVAILAGLPLRSSIAERADHHVIDPKADAERLRKAQKPRNAKEDLKQEFPELKFDEIELLEVLSWMRDLSGANVFVDWRALKTVGITKHTKITCDAPPSTLGKALDHVVSVASDANAKIAYGTSDEVIYISTSDELRKMEILRAQHKKAKLPDVYRKQLDSRFLVNGFYILRSCSDLDCSEAPLSAMLQIISERKELPIIFWATFEKKGLDPSSEVEIILNNVTVEETLLALLSCAAPTGVLDFKFEKGSIRVFVTEPPEPGK